MLTSPIVRLADFEIPEFPGDGIAGRPEGGSELISSTSRECEGVSCRLLRRPARYRSAAPSAQQRAEPRKSVQVHGHKFGDPDVAPRAGNDGQATVAEQEL
jgi:hypothetical protein